MQIIEEKKENTFLPGITDEIFKLIMVNHKEYLCLILLNTIPNISRHEIMYGKFLNVEIPSNNKVFSLIRVDLIYRTEKYLISMEANRSLKQELLNRNRVHLARAIDKEFSKKNDNKEKRVEKIYQLNFNEKHRFKNELKIELKLWNKELDVGEENLYKLEINLDKVNTKYYNKEKLNRFEKALLLLILDKEEEIIELVRGDKMLEKVAQDIINYNKDEKFLAELSAKETQETYLYNSGYTDGEEKGKKKGIKEGIEQGISKSKLEIAKNLLALNISLTDISKGTGLSINEIKNIK